MPPQLVADDAFAQRLPLPLAQLYRRAHNAKTPFDRHLAAYYLWEAGLKLLGAVAVIAYAERDDRDPQLGACLHNLGRPSLGHWWEFVRRLVPVLADAGDPAFATVRDLVLGPGRDDLPRAAGLDATLTEALDGRASARSTVRLSELFERLVRYRNREIGHGAAGQKPPAFYDRVGRALLAGVPEILDRLDVLAGRRLLFVADVRRQASGHWLIERYELRGETARRIESLELPESETTRRLLPERLYLGLPGTTGDGADLRELHPLLVYDADRGEVFYLNARRGKQRIEYLSYSATGTIERDDLAGEQRELLARVLKMPVDAKAAEQWAAQSHAEEQAEGPAVAEPAAPRRLGEFELWSELGRGGMGVVYRAWQPSLGRQVALKSLFRTGDPKAEARFRREIRALGKVEHPHLVKIFTSGSDGDQWFYVMELIEGATLGDVCERLSSGGARADTVDLSTWQEAVSTSCTEARRAEKPLSDDPASGGRQPPVGLSQQGADAHRSPLVGRSYVRQVVELVRQVAEAAHALHEGGILHRDIKPGNLMLGADGGQAALMDLGLAQVADEVQGKLTRTRQFVGTLRYASPEQVLAVGGLDPRSDVYSLGATLWELLTLRPLFRAAEGTPEAEVMRRIQVEEPERPRQYHAGLARDLEAIVLNCLEKDARRRYATARELAEDLGRYLAGEPVQARPVRGLERGWKWVKRRPVVAGLTAAVALALVLGTVVSMLFAVSANEKAAAAVKAWENAESEWQRAEGERQRADAEKAEKARQLDLAQAHLMTVQLMRVEALLERDPVRARELLHDTRACPIDRRDFSWRLYDRFCKRDRLTLEGHTDAVFAVAFSGDGRTLASGSRDKTVKLWDVAGGRELATLQGHGGTILSVAFSRDGRTLATGSVDKTVKLWDVARRQARTLQGHMASVFSVAFSRDGRTLASGSADKTVKLWDVASGREGATLRGHLESVNSVAFSGDGRTLASGSGDKTVKLWDVAGRRELAALPGHATAILSVAFSDDSGTLAIGSLDKTVKLWDVTNRQARTTLRLHTAAILAVAFSRDGGTLAMGSVDKTVKLWDVVSGQARVTFDGHADQLVLPARIGNGDGQARVILEGHADSVWSVAFSGDGRTLATGSADKTVKLWDVASSQARATLNGLDHIESLAFSGDGRTLATGSWKNTVKLWDVASGRARATLLGHSGCVESLAFCGDGRTLAIGSADMTDQTVQLWDVASGQARVTLQVHTDMMRPVAFSGDGRTLATVNADTTAQLWDVASGQARATLKGRTGSVFSLAFSGDGRTLAIGGVTGTVQLWDVASGRERATLKEDTAAVCSVAFSSDGNTLASGSWDGTVRLWDVASGQTRATLKGHTDQVKSLAFSGDGRTLATGSADQTVKLWDVTGGQARATLKGHTGVVKSLAFSGDGNTLASGSADGTVKLWDATPVQDAMADR